MLNKQHLKPLASVLLAFFLAGCAGSDDTTSSDYLLPESPAGQQYPAQLSVMVAPVNTASFLDNDGIVMQISPLEVHQARNHLWAEPLPAQLRQLLLQRLSAALPQSQIISRGQPQSHYPSREVRVQLDRFQGRFDGTALVRGRWQILDEHNALMQERSFTIETPLESDGYPALVRALAGSWEQLADQLAGVLATMPQS